MRKLIHSILCSRAIVDSQTNFTSLIDLLDGVNIPAFPFTAPLTTISTIWDVKDLETITTRGIIYSPSGDIICIGVPVTIQVQKHHKRIRANHQFAGWTALIEGTYWFATEVLENTSWVEDTRIPFELNLSVSQAT